jgi:hypothetical protein
MLLNGGGGSFTPVAVRGGHEPQAVATVDLDRDGVVDVVAADGAGGVTVWFGKGGGSLGASVDLGTKSTMCAWVTAADLNRDGAVDLVTANSRLGQGASDRSVTVLLGTGHGTFVAPVVYPDVGSQPTMIIAADLNDDGSVDLVVPDGYPSTDDAVLLGRGDGAFGSPVYVTVGNNPHTGAVVDLDGDGILDLIAGNLGTSFDPANPNGDITFLRGLGEATFGRSTPLENPFPTYLLASDLDGDGRADLVVANELSDSIEVTLNATEA